MLSRQIAPIFLSDDKGRARSATKSILRTHNPAELNFPRCRMFLLVTHDIQCYVEKFCVPAKPFSSTENLHFASHSPHASVEKCVDEIQTPANREV